MDVIGCLRGHCGAGVQSERKIMGKQAKLRKQEHKITCQQKIKICKQNRPHKINQKKHHQPFHRRKKRAEHKSKTNKSLRNNETDGATAKNPRKTRKSHRQNNQKLGGKMASRK